MIRTAFRRSLFEMQSAGLLAILLAITLAGWGCSLDMEAGSQLPGQECASNSDCVDTAICVERRCRQVGDNGTVIPDGGDGDTGFDVDSGGDTHFDTSQPDPDTSQPDPDTSQPDPDTSQPDPDAGGGCCDDGCDSDQICHECSCVEFNDSTCQYQDQPCATEGQITNGFSCVDMGENGQPRCIGLCSPGSSDDPDSTCPGANSTCIYENEDDANGYCLSACSISDGCADSRMGCMYHGASTEEGLCMPNTGVGQVGDSCDEGSVFSCTDDAICVGGTCQQSCRPFDQDETDCSTGFCHPLDGNIGMCVADTLVGDDHCTAQFTACGADATGCHQNSQGFGLSCYDFCRMNLDDQDCAGEEVCQQFDEENPALGVCLPPYTTF